MENRSRKLIVIKICVFEIYKSKYKNLMIVGYQYVAH